MHDFHTFNPINSYCFTFGNKHWSQFGAIPAGILQVILVLS
mgnify:CR=1 FL=1